MSTDQLILSADRLVAPSSLGSAMRTKYDHSKVAVPYGEGSSRQPKRQSSAVSMTMEEYEFSDEEELFGPKTECRLCQDEDFIVKMEAPCACRGTIKFAHRKCVQKWCNAKETTTCEICHRPYQPDYSAPPPSSTRIRRPQIDLSEAFTGPGVPRLLVHSSPPLLPPEESERLVDECETDENFSLARRCCNTIIIVQAVFCCCNAVLLTLLIFKDIFISSQHEGEDDTNIMYYITLGLLVPSYITSFVVNYWQSRGQKPETFDSMATAEIAIVIDSGDHNDAVDQRLQEVYEPEVLSESEDPPLLS